MNKYQKEYIYRINKVIDYIENNLGDELSLDKLSGVANFSQYHFHRIFSVFVGETLNDFIKRKRLEKAAALLLNEPDRPISDIAVYCGFNSFSVFCRNFKERYKTSAEKFRNTMTSQNSKNNQIESNISKSASTSINYVREDESLNKWRYTMKNNVEIIEMPEMVVIYCRHQGNFEKINLAFGKLFKWAGPRGLLNNPEAKVITYYHDDPKITEVEKVRQSACLTVNTDVKTEGEIGKMKIPGGKYMVSHVEIKPTEFQEAWDSACISLSESGYQPADGCPFEIYHNDGKNHPDNKFIVDICIPVKPL